MILVILLEKQVLLPFCFIEFELYILCHFGARLINFVCGLIREVALHLSNELSDSTRETFCERDAWFELFKALSAFICSPIC